MTPQRIPQGLSDRVLGANPKHLLRRPVHQQNLLPRIDGDQPIRHRRQDRQELGLVLRRLRQHGRVIGGNRLEQLFRFRRDGRLRSR